MVHAIGSRWFRPLVRGRGRRSATSPTLGNGPRAYVLTAASPARDRGRAITGTLRGMSGQDAFGATIPQGTTYDIGPTEYRLLVPDPAAALLTGVSPQSDGWQLQFDGVPGRSYRVESSIDLRLWTEISRPLESSPGRFSVVDRGRTAQRVYRAIARAIPSS